MSEIEDQGSFRASRSIPSEREDGAAMSALIARLSGAKEGSDELDRAMSLATGVLLVGINESGEWGVKGGRWTQSLDNALTLSARAICGPVVRSIGPIDLTICGSAQVLIHHSDPCGEPLASAFGNTPALAVCIATLRALQGKA